MASFSLKRLPRATAGGWAARAGGREGYLPDRGADAAAGLYAQIPAVQSADITGVRCRFKRLPSQVARGAVV